MNPLVTSLALTFVVNKFAGKLDLEDPSIVNIVRGCYIASNIIVFLIYFYTRHVINKKNDLTTIKYKSAPSLFSQEPQQEITTTVKAYDLEQVSSAIKSLGQGILILGFLHWYKQYTQPLILQSIMPLKSVFEHKEVQVHLLGRTGPDFVRPFPAPTMFGAPTEPNAAAAQPAKVKAE